MIDQLSILFPGQTVRHVGSLEVFTVAQRQTPTNGLEWLDEPETVWAFNSHGMRVPLSRWTVEPV